MIEKENYSLKFLELKSKLNKEPPVDLSKMLKWRQELINSYYVREINNREFNWLMGQLQKEWKKHEEY